MLLFPGKNTAILKCICILVLKMVLIIQFPPLLFQPVIVTIVHHLPPAPAAPPLGSYGSPAAPPISGGGDSYGSPQAAPINEDTYGSPAAAPLECKQVTKRNIKGVTVPNTLLAPAGAAAAREGGVQRDPKGRVRAGSQGGGSPGARAGAVH